MPDSRRLRKASEVDEQGDELPVVSRGIGRIATIVERVDSSLKFLIALALVLEFGLGAIVAAGPTPEIQMLAAGGMIGLFALMVLVVALNYEPLPQTDSSEPDGNNDGIDDIRPIWNRSLPMNPDRAAACEGTWLCKWSARTEDGRLKDYVDDTVVIDDVDPATGRLEARAQSAYEDDVWYEILGRVEDEGRCHLFYKIESREGADDKIGMAVLRFDFNKGTAKGWWLGSPRNRDGPADIGGETDWYKKTKHPDRASSWKNYPYEFSF